MIAAIAATSLQLAGCAGASEVPTAPPAPVATATPTAPNAAGNRFDFYHFRIEFPDEFIAVDFGALDLGTALANATAKLAPEQR